MEHIVNGQQIAWTSNRGITDASDLGFYPGYFPESFKVRSHRTGAIIQFVRTLCSHTQYVYRSVGLAVPVSLVVFND